MFHPSEKVQQLCQGKEGDHDGLHIETEVSKERARRG